MKESRIEDTSTHIGSCSGADQAWGWGWGVIDNSTVTKRGPMWEAFSGVALLHFFFHSLTNTVDCEQVLEATIKLV